MSGRSEHLDPARGRNPDMDRGQRRKWIRRIGRLTVGRERSRVAWAVKQSVSAVPPELARQVTADGRNRCHRVAASKHESADAAGGDPFALALDEVRHRGHVDPAAVDRVDGTTACERTTWRRCGLQRPTHQPACDRGCGQAETGDQRCSACHPWLSRGRFEGLLEALAKSRVHLVQTLPRSRQPGRSRDRGLLLGIAAAQLQPAAAQEVRDDLVEAAFWLVHGYTLTFAAARKARSCMTFTAPTVEFISAATSLSEYP